VNVVSQILLKPQQERAILAAFAERLDEERLKTCARAVGVDGVVGRRRRLL